MGVGLTFGPYTTLRVLGSGGMGVVYLAQHRRTAALVALKTCRPRREALRAIDAEIRALRRLSHPGVVAVVDSGEEGGLPWMAMAFVEGLPLRTLFDSVARGSSSTVVYDDLDEPSLEELEAALPSAPTDLVAVASLFVRVCSVLAWLHGEGVVHADLKPENLLIRPDGRPVLVDFGLLHAGGGGSGEVLDGRSRAMGTLAYLAPEVGLEPSDARADLYAIGCMLFELVAGKPPFTGTPSDLVRAHRDREAPRLSERAPGIPAVLDRLVASLLAKSPEDRPAYASDVVAALIECGGRPEPEPGPAPRPYLYRSRLLERAAELERVLGDTPAVVVTGAGGSGRTRLLQEVVRGRSGRVLSSVSGRATDGRDCTRQLLRELVNLCPGPEEATSWFAQDADVLAALEPAVATLVGPVTPRRAGSRAVEEEQAAVSVARALVAAAPVCLVIDDLDEADPVAVAVVVSLVRRGARGVRIRASALSDATLVERLSAAGAEMVSLGPLSDRALHRLVADRLALREAPADLRQLVSERAGGSPHLAGELLRLLLDRGLLVRRGDHWRLVRDSAAFVAGIADGDELAARRLEALAPSTVAALERLAVSGDAPLTEELELEEARVRRIVERSGGGWSFVHPRFRARVLYAAGAERRAELHGDLADRSPAEAAPWHRARHLEAAGRSAEALEAWRAVTGAPSAPSAVREEAIEAQLRLARGEVGTLALRFRWVATLVSGMRAPDALPHLDALAAEAEASGDPALRLRARAAATDVRELCDLVPTADLLELAEEARRSGFPVEEATVRMAIGRRRLPEAVSGLTRAVELLERHGTREQLGRARLFLGCALQRRNLLVDALRELQRAEPDVSDPADQSTLFGTRALVEINVGDVDAAERSIERAVEVVRETGSLALLAQTLGLRAEVWRIQQRLPEALAAFDEADRLADEVGALEVRAKIANSRVVTSMMAGQPPAVTLRFVDLAVELAERVGNLRLRSASLLYRAALQHGQGRLDDADRDAERAELGYREAGDAGGEVHALSARGGFAVGRGRIEEARGFLLRAEERARSIGSSRGPFGTALEQLRSSIADASRSEA